MSKINDLCKKYGKDIDSIRSLYNLDPTGNKKYVDWLVKVRYIKRDNGKYYVSDDFKTKIYDDVNETLVWLEKNSNNPKIKEFKDIHQYKTITEFLTKIKPFMVKTDSEIKSEAEKIYEDDDWLVIYPNTYEVSKLYGMNTKWCVTEKKHYSDYINSGILVYFINKKINRKFATHMDFGDWDELTTIDLNEDYNLEFYNNEDDCLELDDLISVFGSNTFSKELSLEFLELYKRKYSNHIISDLKFDLSEIFNDGDTIDLVNNSNDDKFIEAFNNLKKLL